MSTENAPHPDAASKPDAPTDIKPPNWKFVLKNAIREFGDDKMGDNAAALTYFTVLSLFPGVVALVSILSLFGQSGTVVTQLVNDMVAQGALPSDAVDAIMPALEGILTAPAPGVGLIVGILTALWAASNYVKAFSRAMNTIYEVPEGRGLIQFNLQMFGLTAGLLVGMALVLALLSLSGPFAESIGNVMGLGDGLVNVIQWGKWPVLLALIVVIVAVLYWATPNVKQPKIRWISVGAIFAIVVSAIASVLFGFYVANFGSYDATYGTLAGVIIFLFWLNIINSVLLLGGEIDAELERGRQLQGGIKAEEEIQLPLREEKGAIKKQEKYEQAVAEAKALRLSKGESTDPEEYFEDPEDEEADGPKDHYPDADSDDSKPGKKK